MQDKGTFSEILDNPDNLTAIRQSLFPKERVRLLKRARILFENKVRKLWGFLGQIAHRF